jgi:hypothetical protein
LAGIGNDDAVVQGRIHHRKAPKLSQVALSPEVSGGTQVDNGAGTCMTPVSNDVDRVETLPLPISTKNRQTERKHLVEIWDLSRCR